VTTLRYRQTTELWIGVALGVFGLAGVVLPSLLGFSVMGGGYARACLGLFVLLPAWPQLGCIGRYDVCSHEALGGSAPRGLQVRSFRLGRVGVGDAACDPHSPAISHQPLR